MKRALSVLHVVESFGGGVATALQQYAEATPQLTHYLLRTERPGDFIDNGETDVFADVLSLPRQPLAAIHSVRHFVNELQPDVLHAHSSFAGLYVRVGIRATERRPIVYTPHGYGSERADIPRLVALIFRLVESILSRNTSRYAACSPREAALSSFGNSRPSVVYVPNVAQVRQVETTPKDKAGTEIVVVGRLTPARDPDFFCDVVRIVKAAMPQIKFTWVGGGEDHYVSRLVNAGVEITGWLPRQEALQKLSAADLHVHPAAWDGFPMVLLEANAMRIPSLVRDIPAFSEVPEPAKVTTPAAMADRVVEILQNRNEARDLLDTWDKFLKDNVSAVQEERLLEAYGLRVVAQP
ncbi:glycosyltransferase [Arthrobacter sp. Z4-13]